MAFLAYSQAKVDAIKASAAASGPCLIEEIQTYSNWTAPALFSCTSGVLLWGQLPTVLQGYLNKEGKNLDTKTGPYETRKPGVDSPGTILQSSFRYRARARKGQWKVDAIFHPGGTHPLGYVCHHVDVSGPDLLRRAALVGVSLQNDHADKEIVYVNRYDWSNHGCPTAGYKLMTELLKLEKPPTKPGTKSTPKPSSSRVPLADSDGDESSSEDEFFDQEEDTATEEDDETQEYTEKLIMNRFMLVDEEGLSKLAKSLMDGFKLERKNYLFRDIKWGDAESSSSSSDAFGVNLGVGDDCLNYELGWMVFQSEELVGFVYDGVYCDLEGKSFRLGDSVVEVPRPPESELEDEDQDEFSDSEEEAWSRIPGT